MFLFHAHVTPVSKCIANCLPFKDPVCHTTLTSNKHRSCTVDGVSHSSPSILRSRICSKFSPWKQLTGRKCLIFFLGGESFGGFKWAKKHPKELVLWKVTLLYMLYVYIIIYNYIHACFLGGARYSMLLISELYLGTPPYLAKVWGQLKQKYLRFSQVWPKVLVEQLFDVSVYSRKSLEWYCIVAFAGDFTLDVSWCVVFFVFQKLKLNLLLCSLHRLCGFNLDTWFL